VPPFSSVSSRCAKNRAIFSPHSPREPMHSLWLSRKRFTKIGPSTQHHSDLPHSDLFDSLDSLVSAIWFTCLFGFRHLDASDLDPRCLTSLDGPALSGGRRFRQRLPVAGTISASTMHLSGAGRTRRRRTVATLHRVSRGHSRFETMLSTMQIGRLIFPRRLDHARRNPQSRPPRRLPIRPSSVSIAVTNLAARNPASSVGCRSEFDAVNVSIGAVR
jgi:hypothetical protein